jgi:hypothetical protein
MKNNTQECPLCSAKGIVDLAHHVLVCRRLDRKRGWCPCGYKLDAHRYSPVAHTELAKHLQRQFNLQEHLLMGAMSR